MDGPRRRHEYGVMVSSTFTDLKMHRAALIKAIRIHGLTPIVMEEGPAKAKGDVVDASLDMVRRSSAYVLVISRKYGQVPPSTDKNPTEVSITELEFDEARDLGLPILLFIMSDKHQLIEADVEPSRAKKRKLDKFRERAKKTELGSPERVYSVFKSLTEFTEQAGRAIAELCRDLDAAPPTRSPDPIPEPPALYAEPRYIGSHRFTGRQTQLDMLSDWAAPSDQHPILLFDAMGGQGKSMLTWEWTRDHAPRVRQDWAGRFWYSFYERGAVMADFCGRALAYITREPFEKFKKLKSPELAERLLHQLQAASWLVVLDGLERVLVAYHRIDAAEVPDEEANQPTDQIGNRQPCSDIHPEDDELLRRHSGRAMVASGIASHPISPPVSLVYPLPHAVCRFKKA
jgi:hypothetical protein